MCHSSIACSLMAVTNEKLKPGVESLAQKYVMYGTTGYV
jgi:hypothetical protein